VQSRLEDAQVDVNRSSSIRSVTATSGDGSLFAVRGSQFVTDKRALDMQNGL